MFDSVLNMSLVYALHFYQIKDLNKLKTYNKSNRPEVFLGKGVLKIYSKFTGEHSCQSAISINLQSNCKFAAYFQNTFS